MNPLKENSPPVSTMTTPTNSNGNLVDEFEEAFQSCLNVLTKDEAVPTTEKEEIKLEVEQTILRFIDLARQMEAFFLQKRFLLSSLKPEMNVKEDISELRLELARKEELIRRHYEKIAVWQNLLADLHSYAKSPAQSSGNTTPSGAGGSGGSVPPSPMSSLQGNQTPNQMIQNISPAMQQQIQQQQQQLQIQQQMQQMQQMQVPPPPPPGLAGGSGGGNGSIATTSMLSPQQQAMFMQHQGMSGASRGGAGGGVPFPQAGPGGVLQGPLAYLEKSASNIDYVTGITDAGR